MRFVGAVCIGVGAVLLIAEFFLPLATKETEPTLQQKTAEYPGEFLFTVGCVLIVIGALIHANHPA